MRKMPGTYSRPQLLDDFLQALVPFIAPFRLLNEPEDRKTRKEKG
jgi:hypothetical protein